MTAAAPDLAALPRRRRYLIPIVAVAVLVAAFFVVKALTGDDEGKPRQVTGSSALPFTLKYPAGWSALGKEELATLPGKPLAVIRQKDGKGFVVLRAEGRAPANFDTFAGQLSTELSKRIPDYQKQSSRIIQTKAGKAFYFSYIRTRKGTVHTVVIVPKGARSYALNTVSQGGERGIARDVAQIILSFDD
jgi:hypothetical protein